MTRKSDAVVIEEEDVVFPKFNATIEPPVAPPEKEKGCCPVAPPVVERQAAFAHNAPCEDRLLEVLPIVLVGVGVAYIFGFISGSFFALPVSDS